MFTGIIETTGTISALETGTNDTRLSIGVGSMSLEDVSLGDSIAVNGVCLTAVAINSDEFAVDVSPETLSRTSLGKLGINSPVNLEKALRLSDRLGGHLVSGHVDGLGILQERQQQGRYERLSFKMPADLSRYIAQKGSITIDGISLTVNEVNNEQFSVQIIPHTSEKTIISTYQHGTVVNLEVDLIARYLERLFLGDNTQSEKIDIELLRSSGFIH